jgi:hypothetical protein
MRQVMNRAGVERALDNLAIRRAHIQTARDEQQAFRRLVLQRPPQLIGTAKQRHIVGMLRIRQSYNSGDAVRGPELMRNIELLQAQDLATPPGEVINGSTAHTADTNDNYVID